MNKYELTAKHCKDIMNKETLIAFDVSKNGKQKKFTFNAWMNRFSIWHGDNRINNSKMYGNLLEEYNNL